MIAGEEKIPKPKTVAKVCISGPERSVGQSRTQPTFSIGSMIPIAKPQKNDVTIRCQSS